METYSPLTAISPGCIPVALVYAPVEQSKQTVEPDGNTHWLFRRSPAQRSLQDAGVPCYTCWCVSAALCVIVMALDIRWMGHALSACMHSSSLTVERSWKQHGWVKPFLLQLSSGENVRRAADGDLQPTDCHPSRIHTCRIGVRSSRAEQADSGA